MSSQLYREHGGHRESERVMLYVRQLSSIVRILLRRRWAARAYQKTTLEAKVHYIK